MRYAEDGAWLAGVIELDEDEYGGLPAAAEAAYQQILEFHVGAEICHLLRTWTFLSRINEGSGDKERYKQFCVGRAKAFADHEQNLAAPQFPAATAVGRQDSTPKLQVCWLAGRAPGRPLENPRQVSAYRYPRQYGPSSPSFSRAMLLGQQTLLLSGTASIVGHVSRHPGDVETQFDETLANIGALLTHASAASGAERFSIDTGSLIKAYVRDPEVAGVVETRLRNELGPDVPLLVLAADICREELSLEIEAVLPGPLGHTAS
jgi:chorismate lyase / 3-hydroxybenzoate synthase